MLVNFSYIFVSSSVYQDNMLTSWGFGMLIRYLWSTNNCLSNTYLLCLSRSVMINLSANKRMYEMVLYC